MRGPLTVANKLGPLVGGPVLLTRRTRETEGTRREIRRLAGSLVLRLLLVCTLADCWRLYGAGLSLLLLGLGLHRYESLGSLGGTA